MELDTKELGIIVAIALAIGAVIYFSAPTSDDVDTIQETTETTEQMGTSNTQTTTTGTKSQTTNTTASESGVTPTGFALGQTIQILGVTLTTTSIIEDGRCTRSSENLRCSGTGIVRVVARLRQDTYTSANTDDFIEFTLGVPKRYGDYTVTLTSALPHPTQGVTIKDSEYRFGWVAVPNE